MLKNTINKAFADKKKSYKLGLALQGGGSYGAYTKGVLKALLEEDINISAISGTSAGATNAVLLSYGLGKGGPQEAAKVLDNFWDEIASDGRTVKNLVLTFNPLAGHEATWPNLGPSFRTVLGMAPKGMLADQLKSKLNKHIPDWQIVQDGKIKLFINATRVDPATKERSHVVFTGKDVSGDTVGASGSIEEFGAKDLGGVDHFDGAYWRNPCLEDLENENITDMMVITIQPHPAEPIKAVDQDTLRGQQKKPGHEIMGSEIHHHLAWVHKNKPKLNLHAISFNVPKGWDGSTRLNTDPKLLEALEKQGYEDGKEWVKEHIHKLGNQSSYSIPAPKAPKQAPGQKP